MSRAQLLDLKQQQFEVPSDDERNRLAVSLLACLDDPDPAIRDGVVFEALSTWLRGKKLTAETVLSLEASLQAALSGPPDAEGFRLPFAALALSEVARVDRIEPVFSATTRSQLVALAAANLIRVDDYRGFDNVAGWRHGVAHGSDLVLQLALNPLVGADGLRQMADALRAQVAPRGAIFYTFGEPERLARALLFIYRRGALDEAYWTAWFAAVTSAGPSENWGVAFRSVEGLARRHNTLAFLHALSFAARTSGEEGLRPLAMLADDGITALGS